jgi:hypothetical protein
MTLSESRSQWPNNDQPQRRRRYCARSCIVCSRKRTRATLFAGSGARGSTHRQRGAASPRRSPAAWHYMTAEADLSRNRNMQRIRDSLAAATAAFKEAKGVAEIANVTLASLIKTRRRERANAATFAAQIWTDAPSASTPPLAGSRPATSAARGARGRKRSAVPRRGAHRDQGAIQTRALLRKPIRPASRASRRRRWKARAARAGRARAQRIATTRTCRATSRSKRTTRRASDLPREGDRRDARRGPLAEDIILSYEEPLVRWAPRPTRSQLDQGVDPVVRISSRTSKGCARQTAIGSRSHRQPRVGESRRRDSRPDRQLGGVSQSASRRAAARGGADQEQLRAWRISSSATRRALARRQPGDHPARGPHVPERRIGRRRGAAALLQKVQQAADIFPRSQVVIEGAADALHGDDAESRAVAQNARTRSARIHRQPRRAAVSGPARSAMARRGRSQFRHGSGRERNAAST